MLILLALRYRLLWAHVRSRNGRIVLLMVGGLLTTLVAVLLLLGGFAAAAAAIRIGRGEFVAQMVLVTVFINAGLGGVLLGIGVRPIFSDAALRRYPLTAAARAAARHVTALLDPLWLLVLAVSVGLAAGFWAVAGASPWVALPAAPFFVLTNYFAACVVLHAGQWILSKRAGPLVVIAAGTMLLLAAPLLPMVLARTAQRHDGVLPAADLLKLTPPFAAATAMTDSAGASALTGLVILMVWSAGLWGVLIAVERLPVGKRLIQGARAEWRHPCDWVAARFGERVAPLAGKMLRYHLRSAVRYNYPFALPALALMSRQYDDTFLFALGVAPVAGFVATVPLSLNLFGIDGQGFRRYFFLPLPAARVLQTAALIGLIPGAILIPVGLVLWMIVSPASIDGRMITMLLAAGFGGLLFFHALGLWTTLFAPRAIPFGIALGNKNSPLATLVMTVSFGLLFALPMAFSQINRSTVLGVWWLTLVFLTIAGAGYMITLRVGSRVFASRRERLIELLEEGAGT